MADTTTAAPTPLKGAPLPPGWYDVPAAVAAYPFTVPQLRRWVAEKRLRYFKAGGRLLFRDADLEAMLERVDPAGSR